MTPKEIKMRDGETTAQLAGRFYFDKDDTRKYLNIYSVEEDKPYTPESDKYASLTPTSAWAHEMGTEQFERYVEGGTNGIVVHKDVWNKIRVADEIQNFDPSTNHWVSNVDEPSIPLEKPDPIQERVKELSKDKKETKIEQQTEGKSAIMNTGKMIGQAAVDGLKLVGANQANEAITNTTINGLKKAGMPDEILENEFFRMAVKFLGPTALYYLADTQEEVISSLVGETAPAKIKEACKFATQAATADIIQPLLMFLIPLLKDLASSGWNVVKKNTAEKTAGALNEAPAEDRIFDKVEEKEKVKVKA